MTKGCILQIQYFLKLWFLECYFFEIGHISLLLNIRKRIYQVSNWTWNRFKSCNLDWSSVFLNKSFKKSLTDIFVKKNLISKDLFQSEHKKSIKIIEVDLFRMIFIRIHEFFMIRYGSVIVFLFNSFCNISSEIFKFFSCRFEVVVFILVFFRNWVFLEWSESKVNCRKIKWLLFFEVKEVKNLREIINTLSQLISVVKLTINFRNNINEWKWLSFSFIRYNACLSIKYLNLY